MTHRAASLALVLVLVATTDREAQTQAPPFRFHLLEATIADVHRGIQEGQITCRGLVQAYINRARAYNGTCNQLVTEANVDSYLPNKAATVYQVASRRRVPPPMFPPLEGEP